MRSAIEIVTALCCAADAMAENRSTNISDAALRTFKEEIARASMQLSESEYPIDYEARCLVDCVAELAYARTDADQRREERALMYVNSFRTFLRIDLNRAQRLARAG
jgi:hypothetical protein